MNVYVLNTLGIGEDTVDFLSRGISISGIIGLSNRDAGDKISGFAYQGDCCKKRGLPFIELDTYNMSSSSDKKKLLDLEIDVLLVIGWQRLIPEWLIQHCGTSIGIHGSPLGITKGRGRSPQNWALIMGMDSFEISIFEIDKGIDSGRVLATSTFNYTGTDDIKTSYYKCCLLTSKMIIDLLKKPNFLANDYPIQDEDEAEYFPQRTAEDGNVDWNRSNAQICNLVRGLTRPYPGASTSFKENDLKIWKIESFETQLDPSDYKTGEIVQVFNANDLLVCTKEGFLLITDYSSETTPKTGDVFSSSNFHADMQVVIDRHQSKYPDLPLSRALLDFAKS